MKSEASKSKSMFRMQLLQKDFQAPECFEVKRCCGVEMACNVIVDLVVDAKDWAEPKCPYLS